jgi:hypothetical protein
MNNDQSQKLLKMYGIILAYFIVTGLLLTVICTFAGSAWKEGLRRQTNLVLDQSYPGKYLAGNHLPFDSLFSINGAAFELLTGTGEIIPESYTVISKTVTVYGPVICVFLCNSDGNAEFVGFSALPEKLENQFKSPMLAGQIPYWEKRLSAVPLLRKGT